MACAFLLVTTDWNDHHTKLIAYHNWEQVYQARFQPVTTVHYTSKYWPVNKQVYELFKLETISAQTKWLRTLTLIRLNMVIDNLITNKSFNVRFHVVHHFSWVIWIMGSECSHHKHLCLWWASENKIGKESCKMKTNFTSHIYLVLFWMFCKL